MTDEGAFFDAIRYMTARAISRINGEQIAPITMTHTAHKFKCKNNTHIRWDAGVGGAHKDYVVGDVVEVSSVADFEHNVGKMWSDNWEYMGTVTTTSEM